MVTKKEIALHVIPMPAPNTRTVLDYRGEGTVVMKGKDSKQPDLCCGECGATLVSGAPRSAFVNIVFRCNGCNAFNET